MTTTFSLLIIQNEIVRKVALKADETTVGRDAKMDILIADPAISRRQFTITQRGDHIFVEMNPQSRYQAVKGGQPKRQLELYPGERFELGPYRFELEAQVALPQAQRGPLDEDPGGPVMLSLADEEKRIAPRWRAFAEPAEPIGEAPAAPPAEVVPTWRRIALPGAALAVVGFLAYDMLRPPPPPPAAADSEKSPDLLAAVQPIDCQGKEVCLNRARDLYQIGIKLGESGTRDLLSLYKSAKQLHLARMALGKDVNQIPELAQRADRAQRELATEFSDLWFRYRRAQSSGQSSGEIGAQLQTLRPILRVCREDRHRFCQDQELIYKRLEEQAQQKRE